MAAPWYDAEAPVRFLGHVEWLTEPDGLDLYPAEAALLVLLPFLRRRRKVAGPRLRLRPRPPRSRAVPPRAAGRARTHSLPRRGRPGVHVARRHRVAGLPARRAHVQGRDRPRSRPPPLLPPHAHRTKQVRRARLGAPGAQGRWKRVRAGEWWCRRRKDVRKRVGCGPGRLGSGCMTPCSLCGRRWMCSCSPMRCLSLRSW
ncbi:hypothetical protein ACQYWQ_06925 [Streptomyces sp. P6-2-1]|uniref:hypothetical protein n=1 Tax=Streptomyces sp. P6-2-1 TaxID=3422591 RepID=UPI003D366DEE